LLFLWIVSISLAYAQDNQEYKPCTGPSCDPSHKNHRKDSKFVPHKKKQVTIKHLRKQQLAKSKHFQKQFKKHQKIQRKLQVQRQKNPKKFHKTLDKAQNPYRLRKYKPKNLDNLTQVRPRKIRKKGLDHVTIPSYRFKHQQLDNQKFAKAHQKVHKNLDKRRFSNYAVKHKNLDKRRLGSYKVKHGSLDGKRYAKYQPKHHQRDMKKMATFQVKHSRLDKRRMASYNVPHQNLDKRRIYNPKKRDREPAFKVDKPTRVAPKYARKIRKGIIEVPSSSYVLLNRNPKNIKTMKHKYYDRVTMPKYKLSHHGLDGISPKRFKTKHLNLDWVTMPQYKPQRLNPHKFCYPKMVIPHRNLDNLCYPKLVIPHKNLDNACYPKLVIPHKNLDNACYPKLVIPHKNLDNACYPKLVIPHKQLDFACGEKPYRIKHKQLDFACGEKPFRIKHKQLDNVCYKSLQICHRPLDKYKVPCDPNIVQPKSNLERVGDDLKYFFTNKKRFCKLNSLYSGVSAGQIIETQKYGKGVVTDYVIKNRLIQYVRYINGDSTKIKVRYRKSPSIKHLIVLVPRNEKHLRKPNGDPNLKKVKLSQKETKEIMMKHLVEKRNFVWLIRMYPEEEQNLPELYAKYGGYKEIKHPAFQKR